MWFRQGYFRQPSFDFWLLMGTEGEYKEGKRSDVPVGMDNEVFW